MPLAELIAKLEALRAVHGDNILTWVDSEEFGWCGTTPSVVKDADGVEHIQIG